MTPGQPPRRRAQPRGPRPGKRNSAPGTAGVVWQADLAPAAIRIDDAPDSRPALLLVMGDGLIIVGDVVPYPPADAAGVAKLLADGIRAAAAKAGSAPDVVEVRDERVAGMLTAIFAAAPIALAGDAASARTPEARAVASLPLVDDALAAFDQRVVGRPEEAGPRPRVAHPYTWAGWGLPKEQIGRLFAAAAAYYRAAPWTHITNSDILRLEPDGGEPWSASVMGNAGELFGIALYARHEDLVALLETNLPPAEAHSLVQGPVLSLSFNPRDDVSPHTRTEVTWARWELAATDAWPDLFTLNTLGGGITALQMDDLIAALRSIARFAKKHTHLLRDSYSDALTLEWRDEKAKVGIDFDRPPW